MRTILIPFQERSTLDLAMDAAAAIARRNQSYIQVLLVRNAMPIDFGPGMVVPPAYLSEMSAEWRRFADSARADFLEVAHRHEIPVGTMGSHAEGPVVEWQEIEGDEEHVIAQHARLFDLVVLGRPAGRQPARWSKLCEAALFESGRPVLLAPPGLPDHVGDRIVIAWNGSTETARTVTFAMPFLMQAHTAIVLAIGGWQQGGPSAERMVTFLARHGVPAVGKNVDANHRSPGEIIVDEALDAEADLLVKGAYTRSRLRQVIFGGATEHVIHACPVATLLAH